MIQVSIKDTDNFFLFGVWGVFLVFFVIVVVFFPYSSALLFPASLLANMTWITVCQTAAVLPRTQLYLCYIAHTSCSNRIQHKETKSVLLFPPTIFKLYMCSCQVPFLMLGIQRNLHVPLYKHMLLFITHSLFHGFFSCYRWCWWRKEATQYRWGIGQLLLWQKVVEGACFF